MNDEPDWGWNFSDTPTAEIFDPATNTFTPVGSLNESRQGHAALLLPTGQVLIVGGRHWDGTKYTYPSTTELYDPDTQTFSVMDHLDYGLSEPKLALMNDGSVFIAGQVQAPMDPPTAQVMAAGTNRLMAAANTAGVTVLTGSSFFGTTNSFAPGFGPLFMNQGVDRMVATSNDQLYDGTNIGSLDWRPSVPRIAGKNTLFHGTIKSSFPIKSTDAAKLRLDVYLNGVLMPGNSNLTLTNHNFWSFTDQAFWSYEFQVPADQACAGSLIKLKLKDPSGTFLAPGNWQDNALTYEPKNSDGTIQSPWVDLPPTTISIDIYPLDLTYKDPGNLLANPIPPDANGFYHFTPSPMDISNFVTSFQNSIKYLTPYDSTTATIRVNVKNLSFTFYQGTVSAKDSSTGMWTFVDDTNNNKPVPTMENGGAGGVLALTNLWGIVGQAQNWTSEKQPFAFACGLVPAIPAVTLAPANTGWGETGNDGTDTAPDFSHLFIQIPGWPYQPVHELGHCHGLRHPDSGTTYPGVWPYQVNGFPGIGTLGWDPFTPTGGLNSGSLATPVPGRAVYNPLDPLVIDVMQYIAKPTGDPAKDRVVWVSDYHFMQYYTNNKQQAAH